MKITDWLKAKLKTFGDKALTDADIEALVSDPELTTAFEEDTEELVTEATSGLDKKNKELLKEKKDLQAKVKNGTKEELDDLEAQIAKLTETNEELSKQVTQKDKAIKVAENKYAVDSKALTLSLEAEKVRNNKMLVDNALSDGLSKVTIDPTMAKVVRSHLRSTIAIIEENGERVAVAKYTDDKGKEAQLSFGDYVEKVWAPSDEGKAFIKSKASGGARGSNSQGAGGTQSHDEDTGNVNPFGELNFPKL